MKKFSLLFAFLVALATVLFNPMSAVAQTSAPAVEFLLSGSKLPAQPPAGQKNFPAVATDTVTVKATGMTGHNLTCTVNAAPVNCAGIRLAEVGTLATVKAELAMNQGVSIPLSRTFEVQGGKEPAPLSVVAAEIARLDALEKRLNEANLPDLAKDVAGLKVALNNHRTNVLAAAAARKKFEQVLNDRLTAIEEQQKRHGIAVEAAATTANQALATANQAVNVATDAKTSADIARTDASIADLAATRANARLDLPYYTTRFFAEATVRVGTPSWGPRLLLGVGFPLGDKGTRGEIGMGYMGDFVRGTYTSGVTGTLGITQSISRESGVDLYFGGFGGVILAEKAFAQVGGSAGFRWWFPNQGHAALVLGGFGGANIGPVEQKGFGGGEVGILVLLGDRR